MWTAFNAEGPLGLAKYFRGYTNAAQLLAVMPDCFLAFSFALLFRGRINLEYLLLDDVLSNDEHAARDGHEHLLTSLRLQSVESSLE
ncbi:MAG: hypothetical protein ACK6DZ_04110 [Acidobacteriota bacterium]